MNTLDDILGNNPPKDAAPKGTLQWTMQQNGETMPPAVQPKPVEMAPLPETRVGTPAKPQVATPVPPRTANVETEEGGNVEDMPRNNEELYKILNRSKKPLTDEELEKARKKEKRDKMFSAIGDGVMALSNLFFTTRGAPSMYTGKHSMSEKTRERYEKLKKEREDNETAYNEGLRRARLMDERKAEAERAWQRQLGLDEYNRKRVEAKDELDRQMFDLNRQLQEKKISAAEADAKRKGFEAKYAEELAKAKVDTEKARGKAQSASASASSARARYYNEGGATGGKAEYPWYDKDGNKHFAHSYEAMRQNSIDNGTWNETTETSITNTQNSKGRTVKSSETTRPGKGHSSQRQKQSPTAEVKSNRKKSPTA